MDQPYRLICVFDNNPQTPPPFKDVPLYYGKEGFEEWLKKLQNRPISFLVAIGDKGTERVRIHDDLKSHGLQAATVMHRTSFVAPDAVIGEGTQILAQAAVCVETRLGKGCIINTAATIDHECCLGDGVHVAPGAHLAGCVEVGDYATIYTNATVIPRIKIGKGAIIAAGSVVIKDVPDAVLVAGNPARIIRKLTNYS